MKKDLVPQDASALSFREVQYAVDEQGQYVQVLSKGWEAKSAALAHANELHAEQAQQVLQEVKAGKLSPLAFHMAQAMMDAKLLGEYVELPARRIQKLCTPEGWASVDDAMVAKLAHALNLAPSELKALP